MKTQIDFNRVKQMQSGQLKPDKKAFENRLAEIQIQMDAKALKAQIMKDAKSMLHGEPQKIGEYLFHFGNFYFVQKENYKKLPESEVSAKLQEFPLMPVTVFKIPKSETEIPPVLKNRKIEIIEAGAVAASQYIQNKTGVLIPEIAFERNY